MRQIDNTQLLIAAAIFVLGLSAGIRLVLTLVRLLSGNMRQHYYDYDDRNHLPSRSNDSSSCLGGLFLIIFSAVVLYGAFQTKFVQAFIKKDDQDSTTIEVPIKTRYVGPTDAMTSVHIEDEEPEPSVEVLPEENNITSLEAPEIDPHIIQVGAFTSEENANHCMEAFANQGFKTGFVLDESSEGDPVYKVFLGEFSSMAEAYIVQNKYVNNASFIRRAEGLQLHFFNAN
jgi:cell division septation protein DedD